MPHLIRILFFTYLLCCIIKDVLLFLPCYLFLLVFGLTVQGCVFSLFTFAIIRFHCVPLLYCTVVPLLSSLSPFIWLGSAPTLLISLTLPPRIRLILPSSLASFLLLRASSSPPLLSLSPSSIASFFPSLMCHFFPSPLSFTLLSPLLSFHFPCTSTYRVLAFLIFFH